MKIVIISECTPREWIVVQEVIRNFPQTVVVQPVYNSIPSDVASGPGRMSSPGPEKMEATGAANTDTRLLKEGGGDPQPGLGSGSPVSRSAGSKSGHAPGIQADRSSLREKETAGQVKSKSLAYRAFQKLHRWRLEAVLKKDFLPDLKYEKISVPFADLDNVSGERLIQSLQPDVLLTCRAPLLKKSIINTAAIASLNVHYGITPFYRGNDTLFWTFKQRDFDRLGACIQYITEGVDRGNILAEVYPALQRWETELSIDIKVTRLAASALVNILTELATQRRRPDGKKQAGSGRNFRNADRNFRNSFPVFVKSHLLPVSVSRPQDKINYYLGQREVSKADRVNGI